VFGGFANLERSNSMESLLAVWRLSLLVGIFAFPQLLEFCFISDLVERRDGWQR
jgi:hypothetical protein